MVAIMMMSTKLATLSFLKIKVFWNKGNDIIISVHNVTNKILSHDMSNILDVVMWPKFDNPSVSMRKVFITSILYGFDQKKQFFEGCCWFKFNNLGLALCMTLKFYRTVAKGLSDKRVKTKTHKVLEVNFYLCRSYRGKTGGRPFCQPPILPLRS